MFDTMEHATGPGPGAPTDKGPERGSRTGPPYFFSTPAEKPQPFRARAYLRCLTLGHDMVLSRSHPGRITCRRCRIRRTY